jgi:DNA-binding MarR family transcriptional regulator
MSSDDSGFLTWVAPTSEDEPAHRLIYAVGRFDRALRGELKRRLRPLDLSISEFTTLTVLRHRKGLSNAQLARRAMVSPQAMNQVLSTLERKGLVYRPDVPGTDDRAHHRARLVKLTDVGEDRASRCDEIVATVEDAAFRALEPEDRNALAALLRGATEEIRQGLRESLTAPDQLAG